MCKCLYCYKELEEGQKDFHPSKMCPKILWDKGCALAGVQT